MRKYYISFLFFIIFTAAYTYSETISLAVIKIEPLGVKAETARMIEDILQTEFSKKPLFQVVERTRLNSLMEEQKLQISGMTDAESAAETGNILNVQKVVFGSVSRYESEYVKYLVSLRMVDVERAAVEAAETVEIRNDGELLDKISEIAGQLSRQVKIVGQITLLDENSVYVSLGKDSGITPGQHLSVTMIQLIKDQKGQVVMREENGVANLIVEEISVEGSRCRVLESSGKLSTGMTVRLGEIDIAVKENTSSLEIRSVPENARVYLDSTFLGVTPLKMRGINPGTYKLEIRSGVDYKPYSGRLTLKPGKSFSLERELEPESPSLEDIMMLGKIPRRPTDPKEALRRSLIPGAGFVYNGYPEMAGIIPVFLVTGGIDMLMLFTSDSGFASSESGQLISPIAQKIYLAGIISTFLFPYVSSIIAAPSEAVQEFIFPMYSEISTGMSMLSMKRKDLYEEGYTEDLALMDQAVEGIKTDYWGMDIAYLLSAKSYLVDFAFQTHLPLVDQGQLITTLRTGFFYKPWSIDRLAFGFGIQATTNFNYGDKGSYSSPSIVDAFPAFLVHRMDPRI